MLLQTHMAFFDTINFQFKTKTLCFFPFYSEFNTILKMIMTSETK